jgi:TPR repeat protein
VKASVDAAASALRAGDLAKAERLLRVCVTEGSAEAMIELAVLLAKRDLASVESRQLLAQAESLVKEQDSWLHYLLYLAYCYRNLGDHDYEERQRSGVRHLLEAGRGPLALAAAKLELGFLYRNGSPVIDRSFDEAQKWFLAAAEAQDPDVAEEAKRALDEIRGGRR